ncbi:hypothetical protein EC174750_5364 [Escherichia coli 174750]|nr:hypothetical protein EC174750_5364 [Escherichia coli 174750]
MFLEYSQSLFFPLFMWIIKLDAIVTMNIAINAFAICIARSVVIDCL